MNSSNPEKVNTVCPDCGKRYLVKKEWIKKKIKCKTCSTSFVVKPVVDSTQKVKSVKALERTIKEQRDLLLSFQKENLQLKKKIGDTSSSILSDSSIEGMDSLLLRVHKDGTIHYINTAFCEFFNLNKETTLQTSIVSLKKVISKDLYRSFESKELEGTYESIVNDDKGNVFNVKKSIANSFVDIIIRDITDEQKFKEYVGKYVSTDLLELDDEDLQTFRMPERRLMSVSFTDLRGFTAMSETLSPEEVRSIMNAYLEEIIQAINTNDATVDKIVGDEVMALYGAPKYYQDHALRSIKTACDQVYNLKQLQQEFQKVGKVLPDCGVGINTGEMVVGNMGSSTHQDYTVLGAAVNLAARLCSAAEGGQIVITESTLNSVLDNLPKEWASKKEKIKVSSGSSTIRGKIESVKELLEEHVGLTYKIGPFDASDHHQIFFEFTYQFQIKAKGIKSYVPIITVKDCRVQEERKTEVLSNEVVSGKAERIFGKFRLTDLLGKGGMGEVWKARDPFGNVFAVKMLLAGSGATEQQIKRFKREAEVMAKLNHRGICKIIEVGEIEKTTFIAMEHVEGVTLSDILKLKHSASLVSKTKKVGQDSFQISELVKELKAQTTEEDEEFTAKTKLNPLPVESAIELLIKCCQAVEYAHDHGVLHRDLKPSNIMIRQDGDPVIMDFGLAKMTTGDDLAEGGGDMMSLSASGEIVGSIEYMSPEQAEASKKIDAKADVYSLGAISYLVLSGRKYFESTGNLLTDIGLLKDFSGKKLKDISKHIQDDLNTIVHKSLRSEAHERYESVKDLQLDFQRYQLGEVISAKEATILEILKKASARNKKLVAMGGVSLLMMIALSIGFVINLNERREQAETALDKFEKEQALRLATEKENAPVWYRAAIEEAKQDAYRTSLKYINKAIELEGDNRDYSVFKGQLLSRLGLFDEMNVLMDHLLTWNKNDEDALFLKEVGDKLKIDEKDNKALFDLQAYLTKQNRSYLAIVKNIKLYIDTLRTILNTAYPSKDWSWGVSQSFKDDRPSVVFPEKIKKPDLSILKGWDLKSLNIKFVKLENYEVLKELDFHELIINSNNFDNLNFLKGKNLKKLELGNSSYLKDISVLEKMELESLSLTPQLIPHLENFNKTSLKQLSLYCFNSAVNLKSVRDFELESFVITTPTEIDFSGLENKTFKNMTLLISNDIKVKPNIINYDKVNIDTLKVEGGIIDTDTINILEKFNLKEVSFLNCDMSDTSSLSKLPVRKLTLDRCGVADLSFTGKMKQLRDLSILKNKNSRLYTISNKNLRSLDIRDTQISNLTFLKKLQHLEKLIFTANMMNDVEWVTYLESRPSIKLKIDKESPETNNEFWRNFYQEKYGPLSKSLINWKKQRDQVVALIKKSNPKFVDNDDCVFYFQGDVLQGLKFGNWEDDRPYRLIHNLNFLEKFPEITRLELFDCDEVYDFSGLKHLKKLEKCQITNNPKFKFSNYVAHLPLVRLSVDGVDKYFPDKLAQIATLKEISFGSAEVDLRPIKSLKLNKIKLDYKKVTHGLDLLKEMPTLKEVHDVRMKKNFRSVEIFFKAVEYHNKLSKHIDKLKDSQSSEEIYFESAKTINLYNFKEIVDYSFLNEFPNVNNITLASKVIQSLDPVFEREALTHLTLINMQTNYEELSRLKKFPMLKYLNLTNTKIKNISVLKNLYLEQLVLNNTIVDNLTPLQNMKSLQSLSIQGTQVRSLAPLKNLSLSYIEFDPRKFSFEDMSYLNEMKTLQKIKVPNEAVMTKTQFWNKYMNEGYGSIDSDLKEASVYREELIQEIQSYNADFKNRKGFDVLGNYGIKLITLGTVENLSFLNKFPHLSQILFMDPLKKVKDFSPVFNRVNLTSFKVMNSQFSDKDLQKLSKFKKINNLSLVGSRVTDISALENTNLGTLNLRGSPVKSIQVLKNMKNLKSLNVIDCPIEDFSPISNLKLETIYLKNTVSDELMEILKKNEALKVVYYDQMKMTKEEFLSKYHTR